MQHIIGMAKRDQDFADWLNSVSDEGGMSWSIDTATCPYMFDLRFEDRRSWATCHQGIGTVEAVNIDGVWVPRTSVQNEVDDCQARIAYLKAEVARLEANIAELTGADL